MRQLGVLGLPRNYEIFYEALTGSDNELRLAVLSLSNRPTQEELDRIGHRFFAQNHGHGIVEQARDVIAKELEDIASLLRNERSHIEKYGRILNETSSGLSNRNVVSNDLLQKIVSAMSVATTSTWRHRSLKKRSQRDATWSGRCRATRFSSSCAPASTTR